jgi:hypothetical protein
MQEGLRGPRFSRLDRFWHAKLAALVAIHLIFPLEAGEPKKWPGIFNPPANVTHMATVVGSVLLAVSLLALLGIRYPLKMLPLLFFEFVWKSIWVLMWGFPLWSSHQLDANTLDTLIACLMGVVLVPLVMPWSYIFNQYVKAPGDPWRKQMTSGIPEKPSSPSRL